MSIQVGEVVYIDGSSALLGDVIRVDDEGVHVAWRAVETCELESDLEVVVSPQPSTPSRQQLAFEWIAREASESERSARGLKLEAGFHSPALLRIRDRALHEAVGHDVEAQRDILAGRKVTRR